MGVQNGERSMSQTPIIDWTRVAELREEVGPEDFEEVVAVFFEETGAAVAALSAAPAGEIRMQLHFLKGSARNLGFAEMARLCEAGDRMAARGEAVPVDRILACYDAARATFGAEVGDRLAA